MNEGMRIEIRDCFRFCFKSVGLREEVNKLWV